jgi:hypothetical protein
LVVLVVLEALVVLAAEAVLEDWVLQEVLA